MTTQPAGQASAKAVSYAENNLGLTTVYVEAQNAEQDCLDYRKELVKLRDQRRNLHELILDREQEVIALAASTVGTTMSATAFKDYIKGPLRTDATLREMRAKLLQAESNIDLDEQLLRQYEHTIRIRTARMTELGGYLTYLAAVRAAKPEIQESTNTGVSQA